MSTLSLPSYVVAQIKRELTLPDCYLDEVREKTFHSPVTQDTIFVVSELRRWSRPDSYGEGGFHGHVVMVCLLMLEALED